MTPGKLGAWTESGEFVWQLVQSSQLVEVNELYAVGQTEQPVENVAKQPANSTKPDKLFWSKFGHFSSSEEMFDVRMAARNFMCSPEDWEESIEILHK